MLGLRLIVKKGLDAYKDYASLCPLWQQFKELRNFNKL